MCFSFVAQESCFVGVEFWIKPTQVDGQGVFFYAIGMQYANGGDILSFVKQHNPSWIWRLTLAMHVANAMDTFQRVGLAHTDLKPDNVMVQITGTYAAPAQGDRAVFQAQVCDFGLARELSSQPRGGGTMQFWPPEVFAGEPWTARGDVFALGWILFALIFEEQPWEVTYRYHLLRVGATEEEKQERKNQLKQAFQSRVKAFENRQFTLPDEDVSSEAAALHAQWTREAGPQRDVAEFAVRLMQKCWRGEVTAAQLVSELQSYLSQHVHLRTLERTGLPSAAGAVSGAVTTGSGSGFSAVSQPSSIPPAEPCVH
jgi:serine/threonine protein kinase